MKKMYNLQNPIRVSKIVNCVKIYKVSREKLQIYHFGFILLVLTSVGEEICKKTDKKNRRRSDFLK